MRSNVKLHTIDWFVTTLNSEFPLLLVAAFIVNRYSKKLKFNMTSTRLRQVFYHGDILHGNDGKRHKKLFLKWVVLNLHRVKQLNL